jgi:glycosyltransferase involved in cell wall biosynthesis
MIISIAMATYNGERFLQEQLDSLAAQTLLPCELVVGDDGSMDGTLEILERFAKRAPFAVRIQRNFRNLGFADNFLHTASRCAGDWIAFCDQDDVWSPHKLASAVSAVSRFPDVKLFVHELTACDETLRPFARMINGNSRSGRFDPGLGPYRVAPGCSMVFSRQLLEYADWRARLSSSAGGRRVGHDWWIGLIAYAMAPRFLSCVSLARYRRHAQAVTISYPHGWRAKLRRVSSTTGESMRSSRDAMSAMEAWFRTQSQKCETSARAAFVNAANIMRVRANVFERRAVLYDAKGYPQRWAAAARLFADCEYRQGLAFNDHIKDLLRAALPIRW